MNRLLGWPLVALLVGAASGRGQSPSPLAERLAVVGARVAAVSREQEEVIAGKNPQPSVRQLSSAALGLLELGESPARAEKLLRHVFGLQDLDLASPGYGTVPWQQGHPEIKDPNAIEFTMLPVGEILLRHGDKLSPEFRRAALPHVRAALVAIKRHRVPVGYSNIYLMKLVNQLLLGQAIDDAEAEGDGRANFATWLAATRAGGVTEYDSPTYSPIQADCLVAAYSLIQDPALHAQLGAVLDFYWADFAANYFPARQTMTGPASRNYNSGFLFSDANAEYSYYLAGLRSRPPAGSLLNSTVQSWAMAKWAGYQPSAATLALARLPERVVRSRFGLGPGQDRYEWLIPELALGCASAYYGPQDRVLCLEFASEKNLPLLGFVADPFDAPFGLVRSTDRGGHNKPHHLPHRIAAVQEKGLLLALLDLAPGVATGTFTNLASNIILPVGVDELELDGKRIDGTKPFDLAAGPGSVVGLREGRGAVAIRLFAGDGAQGQAPVWRFQSTGNEAGAGTFQVQHYRGPAQSLATHRLRCGILLLAGRCETAADFAALQHRVRDITLTTADRAGLWETTITDGPVELTAGLDLIRHEITSRQVNHRPWPTSVLQVNDRDLAAETLGRIRIVPAGK